MSRNVFHKTRAFALVFLSFFGNSLPCPAAIAHYRFRFYNKCWGQVVSLTPTQL